MKTPIIPRALALVAGVGILAAAAHAVIEAAGGIHEPYAKMVIAATLAVIAGSVAVAHSSWKWAVALSLGLVFGEAYAALSTADRIVAQREAAQVPARAAAEARQSAAARLVRAEAAKADADTAALEKAAQRDCAKNCRALLEQAKTDATKEVEEARKALGALPAAPVAAPLADRLGIDGTTLDLVVAVLGSLAANGLGAVLIAYGAHAPAERRPERGLHPTARDTAQTSFPAVAAISAVSTPDPETNPPKPRGKRGARRKSTVLAFPNRHPVLRALSDNGGTAASNRDLARLMGVTEGEASKRVREVAHLLTIERNGKETRINLKAVRAA